MSTAQTVGESKVWVGNVLYMVPDPIADEIERLKEECIKELMGQKTSLDSYYDAKISRLSGEVSNLELANEEARKTIDRLTTLVPREPTDSEVF